MWHLVTWALAIRFIGHRSTPHLPAYPATRSCTSVILLYFRVARLEANMCTPPSQRAALRKTKHAVQRDTQRGCSAGHAIHNTLTHHAQHAAHHAITPGSSTCALTPAPAHHKVTSLCLHLGPAVG